MTPQTMSTTTLPRSRTLISTSNSSKYTSDLDGYRHFSLLLTCGAYAKRTSSLQYLLTAHVKSAINILCFSDRTEMFVHTQFVSLRGVPHILDMVQGPHSTRIEESDYLGRLIRSSGVGRRISKMLNTIIQRRRHFAQGSIQDTNQRTHATGLN